jgi:hypothetical protein
VSAGLATTACEDDALSAGFRGNCIILHCCRWFGASSQKWENVAGARELPELYTTLRPSGGARRRKLPPIRLIVASLNRPPSSPSLLKSADD